MAHIKSVELSQRLLSVHAKFPSPDTFANALPYPHGHVEPVLHKSFYDGVRNELLQLHHIDKETDLFKLSQSPDLKNLDLNPKLHSLLPNVLRLRNMVYSKEFRRKVEVSAGLPPNTLIEKTDLASSIYSKVREGCWSRPDQVFTECTLVETPLILC